tara:strand:- start:639 stop:1034 length:396 start_codon:yes stop_codon:yes gene_type:complete
MLYNNNIQHGQLAKWLRLRSHKPAILGSNPRLPTYLSILLDEYNQTSYERFIMNNEIFNKYKSLIVSNTVDAIREANNTNRSLSEVLCETHNKSIKVYNQLNKQMVSSSNPNYPSKSGNPSGPGRGNTPKK